MKRLGTAAGALAIAFALASMALGGQTIEITSGAPEGPALQTATSKDLLLVLPTRFFRAKGETGFFTPYIAELHYTTDGGKTWKSHGFFKDLDKPFEFTAEAEGRYGFFVTLLDQKGNYDEMPSENTAPQVTVLVDWTAPEVALSSPAGGDVVGGPAPVAIKWTATDSFLAESPVTLEYTADGGKTWQKIAGGIENSGDYSWTLPAGLNGRILIRVTAVDEVGHTTSAVTASPVLVDTAAPKALLSGPTLAASDTVTLDVKADDTDGSGVADLSLWSTTNNGANWSPAGKAAAGQPLTFHGATGGYGLSVSAVDKAGNEGPAPQPGDAPQLVVDIDTKSPIVRLKTLVDGGEVPGRTQVPIQWEAVAPKPAERPISIFLSPDGGNSWAAVAADIENSGCLVWDVPPINSSNCVLKVTMKDSDGAVGEAQSAKPFTIDSSRPTSAIGVPPSALSQPLGDLSAVLTPMTGKAEAPAVPCASEEKPLAPSGEAQPASSEPLTGELKTTPAPSEPWMKPQEKPFTGELAPDSTEEDVVKAAFAAYKAGQLVMAKEYFQQAAKIDPKDARPHAALGRIYAREAGFNYTARKEAFEAALYEFDKALELGGDDADVYNDRGYVLLGAKRYKDAEKSFRKATEIGSKSLYWCNLGIAQLKLNRRDEAAKVIAKALEIEPDMKEANFYMGEISAAAHNWPDAKKYYAKAVDAYGAEAPLGKLALAGVQKAREALGEVEPEKNNISVQQTLDRIR
jgi:Tfp pilus assembly protein PilF